MEIWTALGTWALALVTFFLAIRTSALASEAHASSVAANRLYELQQNEMVRREELERPTLRLFDVTSRGASIGQRELVVDFRNFGHRSARIATVRIGYGDKCETAEARSSQVVPPGGTLRIVLGDAIQRGAETAMYKVAKTITSAEEVEAFSAHPEGNLTVLYGETDGTPSCSAETAIDFYEYRSVTPRAMFTYEVVASDE